MEDSSRTIDEAKTIVKEFCEARNWDQFHNPKDLAIGMATEASELLQIFRFKTPEQCRAGFSVSHCSCAVTVDRSEVSVPVNKGITQVPVLSHVYQ